MSDGGCSRKRDEIRRAYDVIAADYGEHRSTDPPELDLVEDLLEELPASARVLDAGCGGGEPVGAALTERVPAVGVDFAAGQLELASRQVPALELVQGDLTDLPFADEAFDALVSFYAVIHVPRELHRRCFAEFRRVLRPGAPALVSVGTTDWHGSNDDWMGIGEPMHWEIPGPERATRLLEEAGFVVEADRVFADDVSEEDGATCVLRARADG